MGSTRRVAVLDCGDIGRLMMVLLLVTTNPTAGDDCDIDVDVVEVILLKRVYWMWYGCGMDAELCVWISDDDEGSVDQSSLSRYHQKVPRYDRSGQEE
jgi:hypothetical protein